MRYPSRFFLFLNLFTLFFLLLIAIDASPYLRGPHPYPPAWRWPYLFSNTFSKIWLPLLSGAILLFTAFKVETLQKISGKKYALFLSLITVLGLLFNLSILYYSRAGMPVLVHRILDPKITSHFTTSLQIRNLSTFLRDYDRNIKSFPMYARYHPPFATLIFLFFTSLSHFLSPLLSPLTHLTPHDTDVAKNWLVLTSDQKISAVISGFIIALLSMVTTIPVSLTVKELSDQKLALRAALFFVLVPSILLFLPMNDVFTPLFPAVSLYCFIKGLRQNSVIWQFFSGLFFVIGGLFTLTSLPLILFFVIVGFLYLYQRKIPIKQLILEALIWAVGFWLLPLFLLFVYHYNFVTSALQIFHDHGVTDFVINYYVGLIYAPYDFLLFLGLPSSLLLISGLVSHITLLKQKKTFLKKVDPLLFAFWVFLLLMTLSGSVRLETARIWSPYVPFAIVAVMAEVKRRKLSSYQFLRILALLILQVLVFQTVLVTVW